MFVIFNRKIFVAIIEQRVRLALQNELWIGVGRARELQLNLFKVIAVNVAIATCPDKITNLKVALLCHHMRK